MVTCPSIHQHFGQNVTCEQAKIHFYFPGLNHYLKKKVKACENCLQKQQKVNVKDTVHKPHKLRYPDEVLFIDQVGPFPESPTGMHYVMTLQEGFSRFVSASLVPCKEVFSHYLHPCLLICHI